MSEARDDGPGWARVKQIFHEVLEAEPRERERLLNVLCGDDDLLRARVDALLTADAEATPFLDSPTVDQAGDAALGAAVAAATADPPEAPGKQIGPYKLLQQIGEGGFGVVYMAEQEKPIRRRVALKVIKPGMDTKQVIARFEAERQALAMLDHPNIARVFDAGTTAAGRPYFVMELVKGIPITEYCDQQRLGARERLRLFAQVCGAVHHAHETGIIHRDIKPSNVMVTLHDGTPVPKVIDFGVAKAIRQKLTEATLFTEYNQFIGTPEYMAPEQAAYAGLDVDRRCDVYSLGTLLYELLTGTTPFEARKLRRAAHLEVLRILKEEEPPKPSTRVQTLGRGSEMAAKHRKVDPHALARLLRGDLDWIVMKALDKDRGRRYGTAADLATDIGRYFDQRPIEARPPSFGYRAQKLLRRRRGPFATAAVVVLALVADVAYVGWQRSRMAATASAAATSPAPVNELLVSSEDARSCFFNGSPSPDGTRILHTDWCTGQLYVRDLVGGTMEFITDYDFKSASWHPDGKRISVEPGGPFESPTIIDPETGAQDAPATLAGLGLEEQDWSPSGDHLLGVLRDEAGEPSIVLISLANGERTVLKRGDGGADFSPDGRHVVFTDAPEGDTELFVLEVGSGRRWLASDSPEDPRGALWSPDGMTIVFESDDGLWALPVAEGRATDRARLVVAEEDLGSVLWSPDGSTVVYENDDGLWAVPVADGRAQGRPRLVLGGKVYPHGWNEHGFYYGVFNAATRVHRVGIAPVSGTATGVRESIPLPAARSDPVTVRWAPGMQRMAVTGRYDGKLHVMTGEATTSFPIPGHSPANLWWSADGRELLFTEWKRNLFALRRTVFALDVGTGSIRELFPGVSGLTRIHVSPDGGRMVWTRINADPIGHAFGELVISDLGEAQGRVLARPNEYGPLSGRARQPFFSPDGSRVLFVRNALRNEYGGPYSVWTVRTDGSEERLIAEVPFLNAAVWDPTGRRIAYEAVDEDGEKHLRIASIEDGSSVTVDGLTDLEKWRLLDWSPDGAWLAISETVGRWEFWVHRDLLGVGTQGTP